MVADIIAQIVTGVPASEIRIRRALHNATEAKLNGSPNADELSSLFAELKGLTPVQAEAEIDDYLDTCLA